MANHPHDPSRPASAAVRKAIEANDMEALYYALSPRQRLFCKEYVVDFNGSAAAIRAGYSVNYPDRQAHLLLMNPGVTRYIEHLQMSKEGQITSINPDYIIQRITEIVNKPGARDGDKLRGLEMLARHLGMFIERTEITGKDGDAIRIEQQRVEEEAQSFTETLKMLRDRANNKKDVIIP